MKVENSEDFYRKLIDYEKQQMDIKNIEWLQ